MTDKAKEVIPGGVEHNLAFNYPFPIAIQSASGNRMTDVDGNEYYDLLQAGGPTVLGSNPPEVREAVIDLLNTCGPSTGLFHEYEYKLAKKVCDLYPSVDMIRFLGSGTEACMCAARIARLKTGHSNILKMGGGYHGWSDQLAYGIRVPGTKGMLSHGVPHFVFRHTDEYFPNDLEDLERKLRLHQMDGGTAAIFVEPVGPESGTRPVSRELILILREITKVMGHAPSRVFVEMTRGDGEKKRTTSRKKKFSDLYKNIRDENFKWSEELEKFSEADFRNKKLYLYFTQMGRSMYTGKPIDLHELLTNNTKYDLDHIYPRHFVKDDSLDNNLVLVEKTENAHKTDN